MFIVVVVVVVVETRRRVEKVNARSEEYSLFSAKSYVPTYQYGTAVDHRMDHRSTTSHAWSYSPRAEEKGYVVQIFVSASLVRLCVVEGDSAFFI